MTLSGYEQSCSIWPLFVQQASLWPPEEAFSSLNGSVVVLLVCFDKKVQDSDVLNR